MYKHPIPLLVSFVLGAVLGSLGARSLWPDRPAAFSPGTAPAAALGAPDRSSKAVAAQSSENATPAETETSPDPRTWLKRWVAAGAPVEQGDEAMSMVALWAEADARSALEFVENASRFPRRLRALTVLLTKLGEQDVPFTVNWMTTHLTLDDRSKIVDGIAHRIGEHDPALALEFAFAPNLPVDRSTFAFLISELVRTQPAQALAYFGKLSEEGRMQAADSLVGAWFEADREAAVKWCAAQRTSVHGRTALQGLIEAAAMAGPEQLSGIINQLAVTPEEIAAIHFSFATPDAALALLPHLPEQGRRQAVAEIVEDEFQRDPASALKLARESLLPDASREVIHEAWINWRASDAKAALEWAKGVDDPALKLSLLGESVDPLLEMDPARFLAEAVRAGPGSRKPEHINRAINDVSGEDPRAAAAWIDRMPEIASPRMVSEVASSWLGRDEQAAWSWINSLQASAMRDAALSGAIEHWVERGQVPQATAALAAVSDPRSQTAMRWNMLKDMYRKDPAAARHWLEEQPMNNEVRESWVTILEIKR